MPLPGASRRYSSGSQAGSASSSAKRGRIVSHAAFGGPALAITVRTSSIKVLTVAVSRTYSSPLKLVHPVPVDDARLPLRRERRVEADGFGGSAARTGENVRVRRRDELFEPLPARS